MRARLFCLLMLLWAVPAWSQARITVDASRTAGAVSPLLFGQFTEFMDQDIKEGLTAELLHNRSFETGDAGASLPRDWQRDPDDRNDDDGLRLHWDAEHALAPNVPEFAPTPAPEHSLYVEVRANDGQRRGVYQSGIPVEKGKVYRVGFWLRTDDLHGRVVATLDQDTTGGPSYAQGALAVAPAPDWRHYELTLKPTKSDPLAKFALLFYGHGKAWVDQVSLMPETAIPGFRDDVIRYVRKLHPAFVRWPGGNVAQDYHWMWGIGPRDRRYTWINLSWGNEPEPSDMGTDEYIELSRRLGSTPILTVNVEGRGATAAEAAAWVEYCNGPATSKYGAMRAANGHPQPYNVHYWEIGNEIWGDWVRGHSDADTYATNVLRYTAAMKAVDPSIQFIACGDNSLDWDRTVLQKAGRSFDFLAVHHYYGTEEMKGDDGNLLAHPLRIEGFYGKLKAMAAELVPGHPIRFDINEWNTSLPMPREESVEPALYAGRLMNVFLRSGGQVALSSVSDMVNGWPGGIIESSRQHVYMTPTGLVNVMFADTRGDVLLPTSVQGPTFDTTLQGKAVPVLDVTTTRSQDGRRLYLHVVNTGDRPQPVQIALHGFHPQPVGRWQMVGGHGKAPYNDFLHPHAVRIQDATLRGVSETFTTSVPPDSISVLTVTSR